MLDPIVDAGAAAVVAGYLVAFLKMAYPEAHKALVAVFSVAAGVVSAALIVLAAGTPLSTQLAAQVAIQGVSAAAIAAGLTRTDQAAERARE